MRGGALPAPPPTPSASRSVPSHLANRPPPASTTARLWNAPLKELAYGAVRMEAQAALGSVAAWEAGERELRGARLALDEMRRRAEEEENASSHPLIFIFF